MHKPAKDAQRVSFVAAAGSAIMYRQAAELAGMRTDAWIRAQLHVACMRVFEAHGIDTSGMPPAHIKRPPRLQPRVKIEFDEDGDK
ncbi:MAG TPA: hypothetical protein ENK57_01940 [Polyangiaceae bacterium]|nr:hypothetical protein [Polyangiaceae bacterium]